METNSVSFFAHHQTKPTHKNNVLILAVWEIGNPGNIGQIIRLAHNVGAKRVLFVNKKTNFRESKIKKTAGFSFEQMSWEFISHEHFSEFLKDKFQLVALETCEGSKSIYESDFPRRTVLLAGGESHGIPPEIVEKSELKIHIPMPGGCKSMNVSHALSVAAFEWYRQKTV
jgi:tRNA G18 (ribose-2'-O)-methylase SpoU